MKIDKVHLKIDHLICGFRLGKDIYGGAWCPKAVIGPGIREWIEIDLHREYRLTRTATQVKKSLAK
jgi:hypothetical protein